MRAPSPAQVAEFLEMLADLAEAAEAMAYAIEWATEVDLDDPAVHDEWEAMLDRAVGRYRALAGRN